MSEFNVFLLWAALMTQVPNVPTYEIENFYTYSESRKQLPLPFQGKLFLPLDNYKEVLSNFEHTFKKSEFPHSRGWIVSLKDNRSALKVMNELAFNKIDHKPIVTVDGVECWPTNTFLVKAKPAITEAMLRNLIFDLTKTNVDIGKENNVWLVFVKNPKFNPLVFANILAENNWIEWARVKYEPLYSPIIGDMIISSKGVLNLGYERKLELVITISDPKVKVRKDLLPKLGHNMFVPNGRRGPKDDAWYSFGKTLIIEEKVNDKQIIRVVTDFYFLNYETIFIPPVKVAYTHDGIESFINVEGTTYQVQKVTEGTNIDDIQPLPSFPLMDKMPLPNHQHASYFAWYYSFGFLAFGITAGVLLFLMISVVLKMLNKTILSLGFIFSDRKYWVDLYCAPQIYNGKIITYNWRHVYRHTSDKLTKVLAKVYGINNPVSADNIADKDMQNILLELQKLYHKNATPNVKYLQECINSFIVKNGGAFMFGILVKTPTKKNLLK